MDQCGFGTCCRMLYDVFINFLMLCIWKVANMFRLTQVKVPPKGDLLPDFDESLSSHGKLQNLS